MDPVQGAVLRCKSIALHVGKATTTGSASEFGCRTRSLKATMSASAACLMPGFSASTVWKMSLSSVLCSVVSSSRLASTNASDREKESWLTMLACRKLLSSGSDLASASASSLFAQSSAC